MNISLVTLLIVFILFAVRRIGTLKLQMWQIMLFGALLVVISRQITVHEALKSINLNVIFFLFAMFTIGEALDKSGYLAHISYSIFRKAKNVDCLILLILAVMGGFSALLMNDTLAIIATPLVLYFGKKHRISQKLMLLALCFSVTIGSALSPIGNPQNLLIALEGSIHNPFVVFLKYLALPTLINLLAAYGLLKLFYASYFHKEYLDHHKEPIIDRQLAFLCKVSLCLLITLIAAKIALSFSAGKKIDIELTHIALIAASPIILFSKKRLALLEHIDWHTLIFFAAMFILMQSVWQTGFLQSVIGKSTHPVTSIATILLTSTLVSQLISNVPFVGLYLPILTHHGASVRAIMALASGSTIAGNLSILGAASNIIIIHNAERRGETLTFFEFARIGVPLTLINMLVYWIFLSF